MIIVRKSEDRGHFNHGWLDTYHTFSFADYHDPKHMGFRALRVINQDRVIEGEGFGTHPHRDMEIITYILDGELEHKDSMGTGSVIRRGDVQRMTAGSGITHSEFNHSKTNPVRLLQIWILPEKKSLTPSYEQKFYSDDDKLNRWKLVASQKGEEGSVSLHQDVKLSASVLENGKSLEYGINPHRHIWLQVAHGKVKVGDKELVEGDGLSMSDEKSLKLTATANAELLLFDLA